MRTVRARVRRWGHDLAIVLPAAVAADEGLGEGDLLELTLRKERAPAPRT